MSKRLDVSNGDNWTVLSFWCSPNIFDKVLIDFFDSFSEDPIFKLPHYTVRGKKAARDIIVSLRVLRNPEESEIVESRLKSIIQKHSLNNSYQINEIDPGIHKWIHHGEVNDSWNEDQCRVLNELSNLCISLMKKDLFHLSDMNCAREHSVHLLLNMMGLSEFCRLYYDLLSTTLPPSILNANTRYVKEE